MQSKREILCDYGCEEAVVFENPDYEEAIIGFTTDNRVVYDYDLMISCLLEEGMAMEGAADFIDYNAVRSLPYAGELAPIIAITSMFREDKQE